MNEVKVSIIMPSLNVSRYIRQCVDSVLNQTLREIEVIFVDAGSTDGTVEILQEYTQKDSRTKLIHSDKKSYGYQVNLGFDAAQGEYLGIIETDDYADPEMFMRLYECAKEHDADVAKSGFYYYYSVGEERSIPNPIASETMSHWTFCPATDFKSPMERAAFFNIKPTIWSSVYRRSFIYENGIRLNETPGASYQDASFNFKVWVCAKRVRLLKECFLHYRQDNENSSINSSGKVYCICDEYDEMKRFLDTRPIEKGLLEPVLYRIMFDSYGWNYQRLSDTLRKEFILRFHDDFVKANQEGKLNKEYFEWFRWHMLEMILLKPAEYCRKIACEEKGEKYVPVSLMTGRPLTFYERLRNNISGGFDCLKRHGFLYTLKKFWGKVRRRIQNDSRF